MFGREMLNCLRCKRRNQPNNDIRSEQALGPSIEAAVERQTSTDERDYKHLSKSPVYPNDIVGRGPPGLYLGRARDSASISASSANSRASSPTIVGNSVEDLHSPSHEHPPDVIHDLPRIERRSSEETSIDNPQILDASVSHAEAHTGHTTVGRND
ncbi:hypothetical protein H0H92_015947 [Tricholoma furcatifolium]|nr:hypothetical protein H0H92_015947 [Tricholoma furcatifolium]